MTKSIEICWAHRRANCVDPECIANRNDPTCLVLPIGIVRGGTVDMSEEAVAEIESENETKH
jgi:hypothetical protein